MILAKLTVNYVTSTNIGICDMCQYCDMPHFVLSILSRMNFYFNGRSVPEAEVGLDILNVGLRES